MSTFSVFRRNQKTWLAVLGVLTMLSFVFIPTFEQCNRNFLPGNQAVFTTKMFGNLTGSQFELIRQQQSSVYEILSQGNFRGLDAQSVAATWLKARFAEKMGFVVADCEISSMIRENFKSLEEYNETLKRYRASNLMFEEGLKEIILASKYSNYCLAGIGQQMNMQGMPFAISALPTTLQQQWEYFCALNRNAALEVSAINAADFISKVAEPKDAEVKAYFNQYKDRLANSEMGIVGFKNPMKVKIHYFVYTKPGLAPEEAPADAPVEVNTDSLPNSVNLEDIPAPEDVIPAEIPAAETAPAPAPEAAPAAEAAPAPAPEAAPAAETAPAPAPEAAPAAEAAPAPAAEAAPAASLSTANPFRLVANETVETISAEELAAGAAPAAAVAPAEEAAAAAPVEEAAAPVDGFDSNVFAKLVQADVSTYKNALNEYRFNQAEGAEEPKLTFSAETNAYAEKYGIKYVEMELMDLDVLSQQPVSQALNFNDVLMKKVFTCVEAEDMGNSYIVWKSEVVEAETAELTDEVKKAVVEAWKLEKAKDLAAIEAMAAAKDAAETKALKNPVTVENFARYTMAASGPMPTSLEVYTELENVAEDFRTNVFKMVPGEVKAFPNQNRTIQYVVYLKSFTPDDAELRTMFQNMKDNPQYAQSMFYMNNYEVINAIQQWEVSVFEDAGASFAAVEEEYEE